MSSNKKVEERFIEELDFNLLILVVKDDEIEDKIIGLSRQKGIVSKNFYEDFIISICVANINQLLYYINKVATIPKPFKLSDVRRKIYNYIIEVNPGFKPEGIYIDKQGVLKLAGKKRRLAKNEEWLVKSIAWDKDNYEEFLDIGNLEIETVDEVPVSKNKDKKPFNKLKNIDDIEYNLVKKWWSRLNQYIVIKQYDDKYAEDILRSTVFDSRTSFDKYIVNLCVKDVRDLYEYLDSIGIPSRIGPPVLMHELYGLCRDVNSFLTFEEALSWVNDDAPKKTDVDAVNDSAPKLKKGKPGASMFEYAASTNKPKRLFKNISKKELLSLDSRIKKYVIGQDVAVGKIVESIQRASVGLRDPNKPIGSFLFGGFTGSGKTLTTKILSQELTGDEKCFVTIDCSEYSADHEYSKLIGAPSGYVGYEQGGYLTNAIAKHPFSVVVFDEVEKASHKVHELLLQVLEEGRLTDGKGNIVSFKDTIIIMTSNIGAHEVNAIGNSIGFGDVATITDKKKNIEISKAIKNKFKPEFINRIDSIVFFRRLDKTDYMKIIDLELNKLNSYLVENDTNYTNIYFDFDQAVKEYIYKDGINEEYGARPLKRSIERNISTPVALKLLRSRFDSNITIKVSMHKSKIIFDLIKNEEELNNKTKEKSKE